LHIAHKAINTIDNEGNCIAAVSPNAWKYEYFIFDHLILADKVGTLLCDREQCYAPLKNAEGENSIKTLQEILLKHELALLSELTGKKANAVNIELAQGFYYPTKQMESHWHGRQINVDGYIAEE
jgi:UDP-N-acetylglucosamine/UDP-N-acetylgalactosamine diphosphorylase